MKKQVAPALKERGFRRREQTFTRRVGDAWIVASLQKSSFARPDDEIVFTVNLGVKNAWLARFRNDDPEREPRIPDCHLAKRLGPVAPGQDRWWVLDRESGNGTRTGEPLAQHIVDVGVPFLERLADDEALRDPWLGNQSARHAHWRELSLLLRVLGPPAELERVFAEQRHRYKFNSSREEIDEHEDRVARFAQAHSV